MIGGGPGSRAGRADGVMIGGSRVGRMRAVRIALGLLAGTAVGLGGWLVLRDSSLVRVNDVRVTGTHGPAASGIAAALQRVGEEQTTLHVDVSRLRAAVSGFPEVKGLTVHASFPHGLRVDVEENEAVGAVVVAGRRVAVAADGTLMPLSVPTDGLPVVAGPGGSDGARITDPAAAAVVAVLAGAPDPLRPRISGVLSGRQLQVQLRDGPALVFGSPDRLAAKWAAGLRVLADPGAAGATYLDLRLPERPVAGGRGLTGSAAASSVVTNAAATGGSAAGAGSSASAGTAAGGGGANAGPSGATGSGSAGSVGG